MNDALKKAEAAVTEASVNTAAVQVALAAVELAKAAQAQQQAPPPSCSHQAKAPRSAGEWLAIACAVCVAGVGISFAAIGVAIGGLSAAILALVVRSLMRDFQRKG
ncbi:hypothetical protein ACIRU8_10320 [Streptomyces sp. NPDC101175]|uniref:hypothetical protein n=1 Tax=Streptomyces sp. NPDC101175 TaxID=3366123 RepID=UPI0038339BF9